jgi:putative hydrolase of the HAD superfamily
MKYDALILDYGEVLSHPQDPEQMAAIAALLGVSVERLRAAYWLLRADYDLGMPAEEYWWRTAGSLGLKDLHAKQLAKVIEYDVAAWTRYREEMWDVARDVRTSGGRTAFLSNGVPEIMTRIRRDRPLERWFDVVVVSCEVGLAKPQPDAYQLCLERLGTAADRTLFVDDREVNTAAAAALGIAVLTFEPHCTAADVRRALGLES